MDFITDEKFLIPLLATLGASFAVIFFQSINNYIKENRQRIYTINYMLEICWQILNSEFIIKKHTINPHIEAMDRILEGDSDLLNKMFCLDDFDILKDSYLKFDHLPEEYKLLVGYDNIDLIQMFYSLNYMTSNEYNRISLNEFVKQNLKNASKFNKLPDSIRLEILNTYSSYLISIRRQYDRNIYFIIYLFYPEIKKYLGRIRFLFFSTDSVKKTTQKIEKSCGEYRDLIPKKEFLEKVKNSGIQSVL